MINGEMSALLQVLQLLIQLLEGGQNGQNGQSPASSPGQAAAPSAAGGGAPSSGGGGAPSSGGAGSPSGSSAAAPSSGGSPGGSSSASPTSANSSNPGGNIIPNVPNGTYGGQCGKFVANQTGGAFPDATAKQFLDPNGHPGFYETNTPAPGDIFVSRGGKDGIPTSTGHTGFVKSVNPNGSLTVIDSNWNDTQQVLTHNLPASAVDGYLRKNGT